MIDSNEETRKAITIATNQQNKIFKEAFVERPAIEDLPNPVKNPVKNPDGSIISFSKLADKYLSIALNKKIDYDSTFGIHRDTKNNILTLGEEQIEIDKNNDLLVGGNRYPETEGLWELLTKQKPDDSKITNEDKMNYQEIMLNTNNLFTLNKIKGNKQGIKYTNYIRPIISEHFPEKLRKLPSVSQTPTRGPSTRGSPTSGPSTSGKGFNSIILPCNPDDLLERMDLLIESKKAGNTGVVTELTAIINKLYKDKIIDKNSHKKLISNL